MKKIISFEKELSFPSMIGEIVSISLDQQIEFKDPSLAIGKFVVSGTYKMTEASTLTDDFNYEIPVEIDLAERLDLSSTKTSISNFNYEIINDDVLKCNIDLLIEGVEEIILDNDDINDELLRECDGDLKNSEEKVIEEQKEIIDEAIINKNNEKKLTEKIIENEIDMPKAELKDNIIEEKEKGEIQNNNVSSLFQVFENSEETFTTYSIYIMRKEDSLEKILDMYKITKEELEEYNDLNNLEIGSKIVIPTTNNE